MCEDVEMGSGEGDIGESASDSTDSPFSTRACLPIRTHTVSVEGPNG